MHVPGSVAGVLHALPIYPSLDLRREALSLTHYFILVLALLSP